MIHYIYSGIKLTSLKAEKSRNEEILNIYKDNKEFLDNLATKEWNKTKEKKKDETIKKLKDKWVETMIDKDEETIHASLSKGGRDRRTKIPKKAGLSHKQFLEEIFEKKVRAGEM